MNATRALVGMVPCILLGLASPTFAAVVLDFETDDFGVTLTNGQSIGTSSGFAGETVFEFGNHVNVSSLGTGGHLGAAIFDSTPGINSADPDLWIDFGNILILQANASPAKTLDPTFGWVFDDPNDEADFADRGSIVFDFNIPSELTSIDLVDINGGAHVTLTLFDGEGDRRIYDVPSKWTTDVSVADNGWQTLFLNTVLPQPSEPLAIGGDAVVTLDEAGFDPTQVVTLQVAFDGDPSSAGLDNLKFTPVPEPATPTLGLLAGAALCGVYARRHLRSQADLVH